MVQPIAPPPKNYRAKTRLARCRAREEKIKQRQYAKVQSPAPTNDSPKRKSLSSWANFDDEDHLNVSACESVEVELCPSGLTEASSTSQEQWTSEPIDNDIKALQAIPIPAPSTLSNTPRSSSVASIPSMQLTISRSYGIAPLQQRDTNADSDKSNENSNENSRKVLVPRPIVRGRSNSPAKAIIEATSTSKSNQSRRRSSSNMRLPSERKDRRSLIAKSDDIQVEDFNDLSRPNRSRSIERNPTIIRAKRKSASANGTRHRSLSLGRLKSNSVGKGNTPNHMLTISPQKNSPIGAATFEEGRPVYNAHCSPAISTSVILPRPIHMRNLLTSSVYNNQATGIWITTINMNQKTNVTKSNAAKYLKAFSFHTEREARESAYANAPARMMPFEENSRCFTCRSKFTVLRRASHCRNCGVCICNNCSISWSKLSLPETYNVKNESYVKVCSSCDTLSQMFKKALLDANYENALTIYNTGNINLRCQFMTSKGAEAMLPIHCAAEGGSLKLLRWLVDVHYCPIKRIRTGNRFKNQNSDELITTSRGRNILEIAMTSKSVEILNYLVNGKNIGFEGIRSLDIALSALEAVLLEFPKMLKTQEEQENVDDNATTKSCDSPFMALGRLDNENHTPIKSGIPLYEIRSFDSDENSEDDSCSHKSYGSDFNSDDEESVATTVHDACIICYENTIDCVITPCGHQICCLHCTKNVKHCPVCNVECKFIKIFRP